MYIKIKRLKEIPGHWHWAGDMDILRGAVLETMDAMGGDVHTESVEGVSHQTNWTFFSSDYTKSTKAAYTKYWATAKNKFAALEKKRIKAEKADEAKRKRIALKELKALGPFAKVFEGGDWGCQGDSVKEILTIINRELKKL